MSRLSMRTFKHNVVIENIVMFLLPYDFGYKRGFIDGMKKGKYFTGYTDGYEDAVTSTVDSYKKFFDNPKMREKGISK